MVYLVTRVMFDHYSVAFSANICVDPLYVTKLSLFTECLSLLWLIVVHNCCVLIPSLTVYLSGAFG